MANEKLKEILDTLSTPEEREQFKALEMQKEADKKLNAILESFEKAINFSKKSNSDISKTMVSSFENFVDKLGAKIDELKGTVSTSFVKNKPENIAPVYKDIINQLSSVKDSIDKKPVPVWNWPQYASVGVRDKSFSNINPSLAYQHNTTTPTTPYGTSLVYDSSGTIKVVSSTNKLPVDATLTSSSLVGLEVSLANGAVGDGTVNLTSAGTAQQVSTSSVPCKRVIITAHESNTNAITIGASTVVGALAGRRGKTLYPTQSEIFFVSNLNILYFDGITTGDDISFYYES